MKDVIRCYAISDLHADSERGKDWVVKHCHPLPNTNNNTYNCLILAGDICTEINRLKELFDILVQRFDAVCFVPGNHEAWRQGIASGRSAFDLNPEAEGNRMAVDSIYKLAEVLDCARSTGVYIGPLRINSCPSESKSTGLTIFPLYSWYHATFDTEPDLINSKYLAVEQAIPFDRKWGDFTLCSWPQELISSDEFITTSRTVSNTRIAEAFGQMNEPFLYPPNESKFLRHGQREGSPVAKSNDFILSFSHFLPKQELCPEKRFLLEPLLTRVIGSCPLEEQVMRLKPHLHLFGHTHIPMDLTIDNIRYIQWPHGYAREAQRQCSIVHDSGPLLVYDSSLGAGHNSIPSNLKSLRAFWSDYYRVFSRDPTIVEEISPWLEKRLDSFSGFVYSRQKRAVDDQNKLL